MLKRTLQVKMVKEPKDEPIDYEEEDKWFEERVTLIGDEVTKVAVKIGAFVVAYVIADTFRQVMVEKAKK